MAEPFKNLMIRQLHPRVGRPYPRPVGPGCVFRYFTEEGKDGAAGPTSCDLVLGVNRPSAAESQAFVSGVAEFVLVDLNRIPFVCVRFDQSAFEGGQIVQRPLIGWQECPVHPLANHGDVPAVPEDTVQWPVNMVLVEVTTRLTGGIRLVRLETEFCQAFARAMQACRNHWDTIAAYDAQLDGIYQRYPAGSIPHRGRLLAQGLGID